MKKMLTAVGLLLLATGVAILSRPRTPQLARSLIARPDVSPTVPDHVLYRMFFHEVYLRKKEALESESRGNARLATGWRNNKLYVHLSNGERTTLEQIADACEQQVERQDAVAKLVIQRDRARYPGGIVPAGHTVQAPSTELYALQMERNNIILRNRDQLQATLGEERFKLIRDFVEFTLMPEITSARSLRQ